MIHMLAVCPKPGRASSITTGFNDLPITMYGETVHVLGFPTYYSNDGDDTSSCSYRYDWNLMKFSKSMTTANV